jgi:hypothetical protein
MALIPILLLVLLDAAFNLYFWRIPKLTSRAADYGYQFLLDVHRLEQTKPPEAIRVVAFGSSVAGSLDGYQVERLVNASQHSTQVDVHRLMKPGMKPSDYRLVFEAEQQRMQPDVVIVMLNFQDFLNPSFEGDLKRDVQYVLPPWTTLRHRWPFISTVSGKLDLALASVSNLYRYRRPIRSCVQDHMRVLAQWIRGRSPKRPYGWYPDGYSKQRFGLPVSDAPTQQIKYFVHPEWLRQRGTVTLTFAMGRHVLAQRVETEPGWKTVDVPLPAPHGRILDVTADSLWSPRAAGMSDDFRLLGVQVRTSPVDAAANGTRPPFRYPPVDDGTPSEFLRMGRTTGDAFVRKWEAALAAENDFGIRFRAWRDSKLRVRDDPFEPTGEFAQLEQLVADLSRRGVSVVLVNTPESPLVGDYQTGTYYRGYLQFFERLAQTYPHVRFYNLVNSLPAEDFNDSIHVNYVGEIKIGHTYADIIRDAMRERGQAAAQLN